MPPSDNGESGPLSIRRRALALGAAIALLAIVASSGPLHGWLVSVLPAAESVIRERPVFGVTVFVLFAALSAMLAFVSSALIVPVGVYVWGEGISFLLLLVGWVLGGIFTYGVGRYLGRPVVRALTSVPLLERYEARLARHAPFGLVLLFQAALPSEVPGYVLGLLRYTFWKYLTVLTLTELPYSAATIYLGSSFVQRRIAVLVVIGAAMAVFSVWALHALHRRIQEYRD
jgi:uncharacterized membrane protein YdjX (TVP38/TMEM64 family)